MPTFDWAAFAQRAFSMADKTDNVPSIIGLARHYA